MHISDQYCLRAVLYYVYRCCLANIETILGLFYQTHISEIRKILLNCFISQFNFIRHSCLHVLISVLSKNKCYYSILCQNCSILSKQYHIPNTDININSIQKELRNHETHRQWRKCVKIIGGDETKPSKVAHIKKHIIA